jgi:hypothetical protein
MTHLEVTSATNTGGFIIHEREILSLTETVQTSIEKTKRLFANPSKNFS